MTAAITTRTHRALQWTSENNKEVSKTYLCQLKGPLKVRGGKIRPVLKTTTQQSSMTLWTIPNIESPPTKYWTKCDGCEEVSWEDSRLHLLYNKAERLTGASHKWCVWAHCHSRHHVVSQCHTECHIAPQHLNTIPGNFLTVKCKV